MICAHEPSLDPRIRWEAESAARQFDVTVLGFNRDDGFRPAVETVHGYRVRHLVRPRVSGLAYLWRLKDALPLAVSRLLAPFVVLSAPAIVAGERLGGALRGAARQSSGGNSPSRLRSVLGAMRRGLAGRIEHVLTVLRVQFAPASVAFCKYLRALPEKPDIVHCNDLDTLLVGVIAKQRYGCHLVYDAHEFYPFSDPHGNWLDSGFFSVVERVLIRRADAVVTVNPPLAEAMRDAYGIDRVYAVPNAEPWVYDRSAPAAPSEIDALARGRVKFLFQGRFTPGRGIDELIDAWAGVDAERAALFLRGPENIWKHAAIERAARLGLLGRGIYFLDAVGEDELVAAAAEADVGVIPYKPAILNDRLSCPNKLSQYLHAGLMVLANDLPYVTSVLREARAGAFYSSAEPKTLAEAVGQLVGNPVLLAEGRRSALRCGRDRFNWQVQGETLLALYRAARRSEAAPVPLAVEAPRVSV
ncbi:MAG: glycosyltransferase family 4 protein [Alphaproteobacteria bacterium]